MDEQKFVEQPEKPKNELDFFAREADIPLEEIKKMQEFADELRKIMDSYLKAETQEEKEGLLKDCQQEIDDFFSEQRENEEFKMIFPLNTNLRLCRLLKKKITDFFSEKYFSREAFLQEEIEKKENLELIIDEGLANAFTHCKKESNYGFFSSKKEGDILRVIIMNFSEEEIPEEILSFLNKPKEKTKEFLEDFSNNDIEKINNEEFDFEEELKGEYKKRGLELIAKLTKEIKYEKIEDGELGFCHKFTFEI